MSQEVSRTAGRYELLVDGQVVSTVDYSDAEGVRVFPHTWTDPAHRGRGYADSLVGHAVADTADEGLRVRPLCWYVADWFERHPERRDLLA